MSKVIDSNEIQISATAEIVNATASEISKLIEKVFLRDLSNLAYICISHTDALLHLRNAFLCKLLTELTRLYFSWCFFIFFLFVY